ncbi:Sepiapterin reductase [Strongyloides ratti]|uniref:Sepiapterin reductase n=1 Tax=Strongyloides ratti TaxID=34506 RepID=A0A090L136_STRRB|nr:Sepiapterin reductase [Strongyloides ratti]CEF63406.1 Sepiapterin reductase [Strongyloides ratti]
MSNCFYKGRSAIIITGATGVIGKALTEEIAANVLENSTFLLSSRNKFRLKCLKEEILKLRPDIKIETVVWNLETPDYDLFFSDIKKAFFSPLLYNESTKYDTSYSTAIIIHNASDVGDVDKTVFEHGKNPYKIQKLLNINTVSLISLTSAFLQYFKYFKTKKFIVNMLSATSIHPMPYFGHISLKCANKMILDILSQEESGKLKVLHYNPIAIDTENLRKIKNFTKDVSVKEVIDIIYKSKKLHNPYDISKHLFYIINSNHFLNGDTITFGSKVNNNVDDDLCMTKLFKQDNNDISKRNENEKNTIINDKQTSSSKVNIDKNESKSYINENSNSNNVTLLSKDFDNMINIELSNTSNKKCDLSSNEYLSKENINMNDMNDMNNGTSQNIKQTTKINGKNLVDSNCFLSKKLNSIDDKELGYGKGKYFEQNKNIKLCDSQKYINKYTNKNLVIDKTKNGIIYHDNIIGNFPSCNPKISHTTTQKDEINSEISELNINKPKTLYQEYKEMYLKEKLHSQQNIVIPNSSSFKIVKSLYNRNKNHNFNKIYITNGTSRNCLKVQKNNFKMNKCKNLNNETNKKEELKIIKVTPNSIMAFPDKKYINKKEVITLEMCEEKLNISTPTQSTVDSVSINESQDNTFMVKRNKKKKIYIINGVKYYVEGSFKFFND